MLICINTVIFTDKHRYKYINNRVVLVINVTIKVALEANY